MSPAARGAIARMQPYHPPLEGREGLRLDFNENPMGCSPRVLEALRGMSPRDLACYPDYAEAQAEIAANFGLPAEALLFTNGVDDAIALALTTFVDSGEAILMAEPAFAMYRFYAERAEIQVRSWPLRESVRGGEDEFVFDLAGLREALASACPPRMVVAANPNNPTGSWLAPGEWLELARAHAGTLFFLDEAYVDFSPAPEGLLAAAMETPNLLVARTFSKAYGLAGVRLGFLAAAPGLMESLRKAQAPYNVNAPALVCARAALGDREWLAAYRRDVVAGRELLAQTCGRLGLRWWRSAGNFLLIEARRPAAEMVAYCKQRGVLVRDRSGDVANTLRITCGSLAQTQRAATLLEEFHRL